jgi:hypothetical protein
VAAQASASITAKGVGASNAAGRASANTTAKKVSARNVTAQASASTTTREACANHAAGRASASTTAVWGLFHCTPFRSSPDLGGQRKPLVWSSVRSELDRCVANGVGKLLCMTH